MGIIAYEGLAIPFHFESMGNTATASLDATDTSLIRNSIKMIINTMIGERPMNRSFGSNSFSSVFDLSDTIAQQTLQFLIGEAIAKYEKRVMVNKLTVTSPQDGELDITVDYRVIFNSLPDSIIVPITV